MSERDFSEWDSERDFSEWDSETLQVLIQDYKNNIITYNKHIESFANDLHSAIKEMKKRNEYDK